MTNDFIAPSTEEKIKSLATEFAETHKVPNLCVAIVEGGALRRLYPIARDSQPEIERVHAFPIGSITKSFAAVAVLMLRDQGVLSLEDSPAKYVPELREHPFWQSVTLRHLLSMQSGLSADQAGSWAEQHLRLQSEEFSEIFRRQPISTCSPGAAYAYSNYGFMILGRVLSIASGMDALDFIARKLLSPLRLYHSSWSPPDQSRRVRGFIYRGSGLEEDEVFTAHADTAVFGGLWSTVEDLALWMAFLQGTSPNEEAVSLLSAESRQDLVRVQVLCPPSIDSSGLDCNAYALGIKHYAVDGEWHIGVSGAVPGFGCHLRWSPRSKIGIIAVGTLRYVPVWNVCGPMLKLVSDEAQPKMLSVHERIYERISVIQELLDGWDDVKAEALFESNVYLDESKESIKQGFGRISRLIGENSRLRVLSIDGLTATLGIPGVPYFEVTATAIEPGRLQSVTFLA